MNSRKWLKLLGILLAPLCCGLLLGYGSTWYKVKDSTSSKLEKGPEVGSRKTASSEFDTQETTLRFRSEIALRLAESPETYFQKFPEFTKQLYEDGILEEERGLAALQQSLEKAIINLWTINPKRAWATLDVLDYEPFGVGQFAFAKLLELSDSLEFTALADILQERSAFNQLIAVVDRWAAASPRDAAEWALASIAPKAYLKGALKIWLRSDPSAVYDWAANLEDTSHYDQVRSILVRDATSRNENLKDVAEFLLPGVWSQEGRQELRQLIERWTKVAPDEFGQWLYSHQGSQIGELLNLEKAAVAIRNQPADADRHLADLLSPVQQKEVVTSVFSQLARDLPPAEAWIAAGNIGDDSLKSEAYSSLLAVQMRGIETEMLLDFINDQYVRHPDAVLKGLEKASTNDHEAFTGWTSELLATVISDQDTVARIRRAVQPRFPAKE